MSCFYSTYVVSTLDRCRAFGSRTARRAEGSRLEEGSSRGEGGGGRFGRRSGELVLLRERERGREGRGGGLDSGGRNYGEREGRVKKSGEGFIVGGRRRR